RLRHRSPSSPRQPRPKKTRSTTCSGRDESRCISAAMKWDGQKLLLSPSDLSNFLACPHLTTLSLEVELGGRERPFVRHAIQQLVAEKGERHEEAWLERLRDQGREITEIPTELPFDEAAQMTHEAMRRGAEGVYQATFARDDWRGRADFVI